MVNSSPAYVSGPIGSYVAPPSGSQWINPTGNALDSQPLGNYVYSTSFTVPTGAGFRLSLQFAVDNSVKFDLTGPVNILNFTGTNLDSGNPNESFQVLHPEASVPLGTGSYNYTYTNSPAAVVTGNYVVLTGTVSGTYTLTATVNNTNPVPSDPDPTQSGLLVSAGVTCHSNPVGGVVDVLTGADGSAGNTLPISAAVAAAVVAIAVGGWYTRRRWLP